jgi:hypothetical protein
LLQGRANYHIRQEIATGQQDSYVIQGDRIKAHARSLFEQSRMSLCLNLMMKNFWPLDLFGLALARANTAKDGEYYQEHERDEGDDYADLDRRDKKADERNQLF